MTGAPDFTPTQRRMLAVLRDGRDHTSSELLSCLDDERADPATVRVHLTYLRRKLRPEGMDILCVRPRRGIMYRMVVDFGWFIATFPAAQVIPDPAPIRPGGGG